MVKEGGALMSTAGEIKAQTQKRARGVQDHEAGLLTKLIFWCARRRYGHLPLTTRIRAHDAKLLVLGECMNKYTREHRRVSPKLKELAQLKVAALVGCPF